MTEPEPEPGKMAPDDPGGVQDPNPPGASSSAVVVASVGPVETVPSPEKSATCVIIDVNPAEGLPAPEEKGAIEGIGGDWRETVCRICHLSPDPEEGGSELVEIGCACKGELAVAHQQCAAAWFRMKGNRCCEICGANAKNITGDDSFRFMEKWHERREMNHTNISERTSCCARQPFCHFVMACLVIAFILPWFFRVDVF